MAMDISALIRALEEDPEQRAALRRAVLGDQPDLAAVLASLAQRVDELAQAQQRTEARLETLTERVDALTQAQQRTEERLGALAQAQQRTEQRVGALAQAQQRTEERVDALAQAQQRTEERVDALAQAQQRTEARLDELTKDVQALTRAQQATEESLKALVDTVRGMADRLGKLDGDALERRYRERGQAYFSSIARRLRLIDGSALSMLVDDAERAEAISPTEANAIFLADAVFAGRRRSDDSPVHLVVEASVAIDRRDVRRARERADALARVVDTPVLAVVAGEFAPEPVAIAAQDADVWCVTNGHAVAPTEDLDA